MTRPTVAINGRAAIRGQLSGVERWAQELSVRLPRLDPGFYTLLRPPAACAQRAGHAWEQVALPARVRRLGGALLLSPANTAPIIFHGNVIVIHDALPFIHPEWYSAAYRLWYRRLIPVLAQRALRIITVSHFSASELVKLAGADPETIVIVPGGVDERFAPQTDSAAARAMFDLRRPYVLTLGGVQQRKNTSALERAARDLRTRGFELVAAGGSRSHLASASLPPSIRLLGYVRDELLPGLYAGAVAFAFPSLYEGFGLPALEAMASGVPVVASNCTALPEVCANAALLVDVKDHDAIADAIRTVIGDSKIRARLVEAGLRRAREFTWDRTAHLIDALLHQLIEAGAERRSTTLPRSDRL